MKFTAHKLGIALSAFSEKNGKIKLKDMDVFHLNVFGTNYQIIVNKGKRLVRFIDHNNNKNESTANFIIFENDKELIKNVAIKKFSTNIVDEVHNVYEYWDDKELKLIENQRTLTLFLYQMKNYEMSDKHDFVFEIDLTKDEKYKPFLDINSDLEIINRDRIVYVYKDGERFGNALLSSFYDSETQIIYTNCIISTLQSLNNILGMIPNTTAKKSLVENKASKFTNELIQFIEEAENLLSNAEFIKDKNLNQKTHDKLCYQRENIKSLLSFIKENYK